MSPGQPLKPELKSCPFCGGEAEFIDYQDNLNFKHPNTQIAVGCRNSCKCAPRTAYETSKASAAKAWNTRAPEKEGSDD